MKWRWRLRVGGSGCGARSMMKARFSTCSCNDGAKAAAVKLLRKLLKKQGFAPEVLVTQVALLRCGQGGVGIVGSPRAGLARKQSGGEFASTNTTTGAQDAAFQIARISPTFLVHSRRRPKHIQCPAPSHIPPHVPRLSRGRLPDVASRYRGMNLG